jgi:hypothetical protein
MLQKWMKYIIQNATQDYGNTGTRLLELCFVAAQGES